MAQNLALELFFLVEKLINENSPLIEGVRKYWNPQYFEDVVSTWKHQEHVAQELSQLNRSVQQLSSLILQQNCQPVVPFQINYPTVSFPEPIQFSAEEPQIKEKKEKKVKTYKCKKNIAKL